MMKQKWNSNINCCPKGKYSNIEKKLHNEVVKIMKSGKRVKRWYTRSTLKLSMPWKNISLKILTRSRYKTGELPGLADGMKFLRSTKHVLLEKNLTGFTRLLENFSPDLFARETMYINFERIGRRETTPVLLRLTKIDFLRDI